MKKERVVSAGEAAQMLKKPYHKIIRMIKRGHLPNAYKVGWGWVIPTDDLVEKTWQTRIESLAPQKKVVELMSDKYFFLPSKSLKRAIRG